MALAARCQCLIDRGDVEGGARRDRCSLGNLEGGTKLQRLRRTAHCPRSAGVG